MCNFLEKKKTKKQTKERTKYTLDFLISVRFYKIRLQYSSPAGSDRESNELNPILSKNKTPPLLFILYINPL
jgi:hypothetical protein